MIYYARIDIVEWKFTLDIYVQVKLGFRGAFSLEWYASRFRRTFLRISVIACSIIWIRLRGVGLRVRHVGLLCNHVFRSAERHTEKNVFLS